MSEDRPLAETVIMASRRVRPWELVQELWVYRELSSALILRDLKIRYRQTVLGIVWVVLQPLVAGGLLAWILAAIRGGPASHGAAPDWLLLFATLVPWTVFASGVSAASSSLESGANLVGKVYFPRLILPLSSVGSACVDGLVAACGLLACCLIVGIVPLELAAIMVISVPILVASALGLGSLLAALNAQYRDVKYMVPFLLQSAMFVTVLLPAAAWPESLAPLLALNPMAGPCAAVRASLAGDALPWALLACSATIALAWLIVGIAVFRSREAVLVDCL
jgi:lipopolysaccharide transport system permease protein